MRLIIISGRSGSGKTVVLHALEDLGFYCIDNLPLALVPKLEQEIGAAHPLVAVSIDARNFPKDLTHFKSMMDALKQSGKQCEILYLEAGEKTLLKRYSETRRKHPLTNSQTTLNEAIRQEQILLSPIASLADFTLDTSDISHQALQGIMRDRIAQYSGQSIQLLFQSFGFKRGLPSEADFIFDLRCLPNPYWQPELRALTGLDKSVMDFLKDTPAFHQMFQDILNFLEKWISQFEKDNRSYLTIALGCTGGRHRSVYMAEALSQKFREKIPQTQVRHREL